VYEQSLVEDEKLKQLVMAQSEIETVGVVKLANPTRSTEDKGALPLLEKTTFKSASEESYVLGLLWREDEPSLPNNYKMAKWRLQSLEKKFDNCAETRERYAKSIQDDIEKGAVNKLSEEEVQCNSKVTWYLPYRFVINPKKPVGRTTKQSWPSKTNFCSISFCFGVILNRTFPLDGTTSTKYYRNPSLFQANSQRLIQAWQ